MMRSSRRVHLKQVATLGMGSLLPSSPSFREILSYTKSQRMTKQNSPFYHFRIGAIEATVISDGQTLFPPHPLYAVNTTEKEVIKALESHFLPTDLYRLQCNALVLAMGNEKVLIDTGAGNTLGPGMGHLILHMSKAGIEPKSISTILITHCHLDHIGGLMHEGRPLFPNATLYISEQELNFWQAKNIDLNSMPIEESFKNNFKKAFHDNVLPLNDRINTFRFNEEIVAGIQAVETTGHSPGHTSYWIRSGSDSLLHTGDIFHHPAFDLEHPSWATAFDQDAPKAYKTRRKILDMASFERIPVMSYHMPFPALGHVFARGNQYGWEPAPWIL